MQKTCEFAYMLSQAFQTNQNEAWDLTIPTKGSSFHAEEERNSRKSGPLKMKNKTTRDPKLALFYSYNPSEPIHSTPLKLSLNRRNLVKKMLKFNQETKDHQPNTPHFPYFLDARSNKQTGKSSLQLDD